MSEARRLLVVDDEEGNRTLLRTFFGKKGFDVRLAANGREGLDAVAGVDVVLLDLMMPGMSGLDVLRTLRAAGNEVPVLLLTAVTANEVVVEALRAGANDYVTKPFSLPVLLSRVQRVLEAAQKVEDIVELDVVEAQEARLVFAPSPPADDEHPPPSPFDDDVFEAADVVDTLEEAPDDRTTPVAPPVPPSESTRAAVTAPQPASSSSSSSSSSSWLSRLKQLGRGTRIEQPGLVRGAVLAGRYQLSEPLGAGAFGAVWRARHVDLDIDVALKILHKEAPAVRPGETALESFRQEAMLAARLNTPHAVRVFDFGVTAEGHAFLVMELLKGESLRQKLSREGPLTVPVACGSVADVCDALVAAHRHGVVHRDVKALNVFVAAVDDDGPRTTIKLIDFGAAGSMDEDRGGAVLVGTPSHMAPERFGDPRGTPASDVYAAGVMLHQLLTGQMPYVADDVAALARLHQTAPVPRPSDKLPFLDVCDDVVVAMMAKEPAERPRAKELAAWLRRIARAH
ncbi:MAG TPA: protein kinase [Myxococcota bacterium]